jgi:hypothetical protein
VKLVLEDRKKKPRSERTNKPIGASSGMDPGLPYHSGLSYRSLTHTRVCMHTPCNVPMIQRQPHLHAYT